MNSSSVAQIRQQFEDLSMPSFVESAPEKKYEVWRDLRQERPLEEPLEIMSDSDSDDMNFFLNAAQNVGQKQSNKENKVFPSKFAHLKFETSTPPVKSAIALKPKDVNKPSSLAKPIETDTSKSSLIESLQNEHDSEGSRSPVNSEVFENLDEKYDETEPSPSVRRIDNDKKRLERELAIARERVRMLEAEMNQMEVVAGNRERELEDAKFRAERAETVADGLRRSLTDRDNNTRALQSEMIDLQKDNQALVDRLQRVEMAKVETDKVAETLRAEASSWKSKYEQNSADFTRAEVWRARYEDAVAESKHWKGRYESALGDTEITLDQIKLKNGQLERENQNLVKLIGEDKYDKKAMDDELGLDAINSFTLADCRSVLRYISRKNEVCISELVPWLNYQRRAFHCYRNFVNKLHLVHYSNPRREDLALTTEIQKRLREGITDEVLVKDLVECLGELLIVSKSHLNNP